MKKIVNLALVFLIITSGALAQKPKEQDFPLLNNKKFTESVWDYSKSKKFKYKGSQPIIIDFYATWCVPCKAVHPILVELQEEYAGKLSFYRIDVDKEPEITDLFKITNIPALVFIRDEKTYSISVGKKTKEELKAMIDSKFFDITAPTETTPAQ